jgi:hypothetical protein
MIAQAIDNKKGQKKASNKKKEIKKEKFNKIDNSYTFI